MEGNLTFLPCFTLYLRQFFNYNWGLTVLKFSVVFIQVAKLEICALANIGIVA